MENNKKMYKLDKKNGIILGALSGLSNYFDMSVTFLRTLAALGFMINPCLVLVLYICLVIFSEGIEDQDKKQNE